MNVNVTMTGNRAAVEDNGATWTVIARRWKDIRVYLSVLRPNGKSRDLGWIDVKNPSTEHIENHYGMEKAGWSWVCENIAKLVEIAR